MPILNKQKIFRRVAYACASILLAGCEVGSSTKPQSPYRAPSSGNTTFNAGSNRAEVNNWLPVSVTVKDKNGFGVSNVVPTINAVNTFTLSSTGVTSGGCGATNNFGVAACSIRATVAGDYNIKVLSPVQATMTTAVTFYQVPRSLSFTTQPSSAPTSVVSFPTQPVVTVLDTLGTPIPNGVTPNGGGTGVVTLSLGSNTTGAHLLPGGNVSVTASGTGVATFAGLNIDISGTYTLIATLTDPVGGTITATSSSVGVLAGAATALKFSVSPTAAVATNQVLSPQPQVILVDALGNQVTTNNSCGVAITLGGGEARDELSGTLLSKTMINGLADFSQVNLAVKRYGTTPGVLTYHLIATPSGTCPGAVAAPVNSADFTVSLAGVPAQLAMAQSPSTAALNQVWTQQPVIHVLDNTGALVTNDNSTAVVMSIIAYAGGGSQGVLLGSNSVTAVNGVATFSGLSIPATIGQAGFAGTYTYQFSGTNVPLTIAPVTATQVITPNGLVPAKLTFSAEPTNTALNQPMSTAVTVTTLDSSGYVCSSDNATTVTLNLQSGAAGFLSVSAPAVNGVATFNGLVFPATGQMQLNATAAGLTTALSSNFVILSYSSVKDHLGFTRAPASTSAAPAVFTTQPIVAVMDSAGNVITSDNSTMVTIDCVQPVDCLGKMSGTTTLQVRSGVATFTNLAIPASDAGASVVLRATTTTEALPNAPTYSTAFTD